MCSFSTQPQQLLGAVLPVLVRAYSERPALGDGTGAGRGALAGAGGREGDGDGLRCSSPSYSCVCVSVSGVCDCVGVWRGYCRGHTQRGDAIFNWLCLQLASPEFHPGLILSACDHVSEITSDGETRLARLYSTLLVRERASILHLCRSRGGEGLCVCILTGGTE